MRIASSSSPSVSARRPVAMSSSLRFSAVSVSEGIGAGAPGRAVFGEERIDDDQAAEVAPRPDVERDLARETHDHVAAVRAVALVDDLEQRHGPARRRAQALAPREGRRVSRVERDGRDLDLDRVARGRRRVAQIADGRGEADAHVEHVVVLARAPAPRGAVAGSSRHVPPAQTPAARARARSARAAMPVAPTSPVARRDAMVSSARGLDARERVVGVRVAGAGAVAELAHGVEHLRRVDLLGASPARKSDAWQPAQSGL